MPLFFWPLQIFVATIYLWTDERGEMHITEEAPADETRIVDIMVHEPLPIEDSTAVPPPNEKRPKAVVTHTVELAIPPRRLSFLAQPTNTEPVTGKYTIHPI